MIPIKFKDVTKELDPIRYISDTILTQGRLVEGKDDRGEHSIGFSAIGPAFPHGPNNPLFSISLDVECYQDEESVIVSVDLVKAEDTWVLLKEVGVMVHWFIGETSGSSLLSETSEIEHEQALLKAFRTWVAEHQDIIQTVFEEM